MSWNAPEIGKLAICADDRAANDHEHAAISRAIANFPFMLN
jgi:hypothetical protein